jgi:transketolase
MSAFSDFEPPVFNNLTSAIRALAMDAVQKANSGHPGAPMGMAEIAEVLWNHHHKHNPANPKWADRDRFVLSNGHGSMLLYALLHLTGSQHRGPEELPPAAQQDPGPPGVWLHAGHRNHHRPPRPGPH